MMGEREMPVGKFAGNVPVVPPVGKPGKPHEIMRIELPVGFTIRRGGPDDMEIVHGKGMDVAFFDGHGSHILRSELKIEAAERDGVFRNGDIKGRSVT